MSQTFTRARRLLILGGVLVMTLATLVPCSAAIPDAITLKTLYNFPGTPDGGFPEAGLVRNSTTQVLYGTTADGGTYGWGTIFQLVPAGGGVWKHTTLYSFTGGADGANPEAGLILGSGGVLYGTTTYGGSADYGTVFSMAPAGGGKWTFKTLHTFTGGKDGANPEAGLYLNSTTGVLYGTTFAGGTSGFGTVYQLSPGTGGAYNEKLLYTFTGGTDGGNPIAGVVQVASTQVLYGTTYQGGTSGFGTVFQVVPAKGGTWTQSVLYSFAGSTDGSGPEAGVTVGAGSILYGTAFWGGSSTGCPLGGYPTGCGTIFSLAPPTTKGNPWTFTVLYTFTGTGTDGAHPSQNLYLASTGTLYGTTFSGGSTSNVCFTASYPGCGAAFSLAPPATSGNPWTETILHDFNGDDGGGPNGLIPGASGVYYSTTYNGGTLGGFGTLFQLAVQ